MSTLKYALIIDSNTQNLVSLYQILTSLNFAIETVDNDISLMHKLSVMHYDLVIIGSLLTTDKIRILCAEIKQQSQNYNVPIIFMNDYYDPKLEAMAYKLGLSDYIVKDSLLSTIGYKIQRVLEYEHLRVTHDFYKKQTSYNLNTIQKRIIEAFSSIIEGRDNSTGRHIKATSSLVRLVVKGLVERGYYDDELKNKDIQEAIIVAAPLHDIGKIAISDTILCKPGKFDARERSIMETHAAIGGELIKNTLDDIEFSNKKIFKIAVDMATYHHEKWDGTGYPFKLKGEEIPLAARVMAIADVFDAVISKRCYKEPCTLDETFRIIAEGNSTHFDPKICDVFLGMRSEIENQENSWSLEKLDEATFDLA